MHDVETNVQLWTYEAVLKAVEKGGRVCEAKDRAGIPRIEYLEGFKAFRQRRDTMDGIRDMTVVREEMGVQEQNRIRLDGDTEMDNLAERLLDAKIAISQHSAVDNLVNDLSRLYVAKSDVFQPA